MFRIDRLTVLVLFLCTIGGVATAEQPLPSIVPRPTRMTAADGVFRISADTSVIAEGEAVAEANKLIDLLAPAMGYRLALLGETTSKGHAIRLVLDKANKGKLGTEGYTLDARTDGIEIRAAEPAGLFYGVQTLRQLLPVDIYRHAPVRDVAWTVPCVSITDVPRFQWRGLLIDPARHFIPKSDMMRFIDAMALHKFNRLQVHFTDGQGWRIEIKKYPLLTQVGSRWHNSMGDKQDHARIYGGFYTQDDIRELVRYAADRHVTIVPEIEMPHHAGSAMVAYPELGFNVEQLAALPPEERWGKTGNTIVPRPVTIKFFQDVLDEVIEMFPSRHIHIGGDEANAQQWAELPEMQALMKEKGLKDVHELHSWFIRQMDAHLTARGRRLVGWDEILQGGLADDATVMSWRGIEGGITAANAGHDVIMTPTSHTYFDYRQAADAATEVPGLGSSVVDLARVYTFEPIPNALDADRAKYILGGQAQLWGELIPNEQHREYLAYPRACALIETVWSPKEPRDYAEFLDRLRHHLDRLDAAGIHYRRLDEPAGE